MYRSPIAQLGPWFSRMALIAVFALLCGAVSAREVRVATFNALEGFGPPGSSDYESSKAILARIDADIVGFQELQAEMDFGWRALAAELGYSHVLRQTTPAALSGSTQAYTGFFSRFPIISAGSVRSPSGAEEMVRLPLRATFQVSQAAKPLVIWNIHHKAGGQQSDQFRRAIEALRVVRDVAAYRSSNPTHDEFLILGDLNDSVFSQAQQPLNFTTAPLLPSGYRLGSDIKFPVTYRAFPDSYYASLAGLHRLTALQQGGVSAATFPSTGRTLDYVYVSPSLQQSASGRPVAEVYNSVLDLTFPGLRKSGQPLAAGTSLAASDHLVVFADLHMADAVPDAMAVSPDSVWALTAFENGSIAQSERVYVLTNKHSGPVAWSVTSDTSWLTLQPTSGSIPAGASIEVRASISPNAFSAGAGRFQATVRFTESVAQKSFSRLVELQVLPAPSPTPPPSVDPFPTPQPTPQPTPSPSPTPVPGSSPQITPKPNPVPAPSAPPRPVDQAKKADSIEWRLPAATYGDPVLALSAKTKSGRPVSFRSSDPRIASMRGDLLTVRAAGRVTIAATVPADAQWQAVSTTRILTVTKARQTLTFRPPAELPLVRGRTLGLRAASTARLPVTRFASSNPQIISVKGNVATIRGVGRVKLTAIQPGNENIAGAQISRWVNVAAAK
jgi:endonuclease/exonuclease/phosphatase family metal-dependent hydrolase